MKAALFLAALALAACGAPGSGITTLPSESGSAPRATNEILGGAPSARMALMLYDAPITGMPGLKINIGIDGWQLVSATGTAVPFVTNGGPDIVNLLDLQHAPKNYTGTAPLGLYSAARLLVDTKTSNVKIGNLTIPILWGTPGKVTTAPVIAVDFPCTFAVTGLPGPGPQISLDFNVLHSVKFANGAIYVQPVVAAANAAAQIAGRVVNKAGTPVGSAAVLALDPLGRVVNSTATGSDGNYVLHALPAGVYSIQVRNSFVTASGETLTAVGADAGAAPSTSAILTPNDTEQLPALVD
jgi:hypothetical protein